MKRIQFQSFFNREPDEVKNLFLRGSDELIDRIRALAECMHEVEIVPEEELMDIDTRSDTDLRFVRALHVLIDEGLLKHQYDYGWVMAAADEGVVKGLHGFYSPQKFVDYLKALGFDNVVSRNTLYDSQNKFSGKFPNWEFKDVKNQLEAIRRKNIVKRFCNVFRVKE